MRKKSIESIFNDFWQNLLILGFIIVYLFALLLFFKFSPFTESAQRLLLGNNSNYERLNFLVIAVIFLSFPDILALISYSRKKRKNPEMNLQASAPWRSVIDVIIIVLILVFIFNFNLTNSGQNSWEWIQVLMVGFLGLSFLVGCVSEPFNFLRNIMSEQDSQAYLKNLVQKSPYINFNVHAYHYETRTRWVTETYTDSEGRSQTTTRLETYQEHVTTLKLDRPYEIKSWRDITDPQELLSPQRFCIVKIQIRYVINPVDDRTEEHYKTEWLNFCRDYEGADVYVDFSESKGITDMKTDLLLALVNIKERPLFLNAFFYLAVSLTPFAWAYTLWLDQISAVAEKVIVKEYSQFKKINSSLS